jgi:hypothetical protein
LLCSLAKKRSKAAPSQPIVVDLDEDEEETACDSTEDDVDDDLETPKASQLNARSKKDAADLEYKADPKGKKKGGNLKMELGGEIGGDAEDDVFAANGGTLAGKSGDAVVVSLPSSEFTVENKDKWAGSYVEMSKTHLFVKCICTILPFQYAGLTARLGLDLLTILCWPTSRSLTRTCPSINTTMAFLTRSVYPWLPPRCVLLTFSSFYNLSSLKPPSACVDS